MFFLSFRINLNFEYNLLNLLHNVREGGTIIVGYEYSYGGVKLKVWGSDGNGYAYVGSLVYRVTGSSFVFESGLFGEGVVSGSGICYHLKDHLGSIRAIVDGSGRLLEENDYYAFGHRHPRSEQAQSSANRFKYNGKELQTVGGLGYLDYGARMYDAESGRWFGVDPLLEKYYGVSPYVYCGNNPLNIIDPDGRDAVYIAFPDYKISVFGKQWSNLGHARVLLIDNKTGITKYYEYGRYDKAEIGEVRQRTISNVIMGKDGKPTAESLNKVMGKYLK